MSQSSLTKIHFYFPEKSELSKIKSTHGLTNLLLKKLVADGTNECSGYMTDRELKADMVCRIGNIKNKSRYFELDIQTKQIIASEILKVVTMCRKKLKPKNVPLHIFVFPWLPSKKESLSLGGVNAVAPFMTSMHLFIDMSTCNITSLGETIAHEYNHLVFFAHHQSKKYTLLERMIMEGFAEEFRESIIGGKKSPWSLAVSKSKYKDTLHSFGKQIYSTSQKLYSDVFYGSKKYKKWTGYSVGYWIVKDYLASKKTYVWNRIMKLKAEDFIKEIDKN